MKEIAPKNKCSGCSVCVNICPNKCIKMSEDRNGFRYYEINEEDCIDCGACRRVCPVMNEYHGNEKGKAYACINKNEEIRKKSSSGGVFTLLAEYIIDQGGVVFGAALNDNLDVHHISVDKKEELNLLRGSKYVQSDIEFCYIKAKEMLDRGRMVLFSGTPCQIAGLYSFLKKEYSNLITQDIICHGVPSYKVWRKYLEYQKEKYNSDISSNENIFFRNKDNGWLKCNLSICFDNGDVYKNNLCDDLYFKSFLSDVCLRESCYECHFKSLNRMSDITLADFWGVDKVIPEMFDDKGTSLVIVNSNKGRDLFNKISDKMKYIEADFDEAVKYNPSINNSVNKNKRRSKFFDMLDKKEFSYTVKQCTKIGLKRKLYNKLVKLKRIFK